MKSGSEDAMIPHAALVALIEKWRTEAAIKDSFHATMGIGWKACANDLEAVLEALVSSPARSVEGPEGLKEMQEHDDQSRVDQQTVMPPERATAASNEAIRAEKEDVTGRTVGIIRDLYDLKEDVLHSGGVQPDFDGGMLEGALAILNANVDDEDPRVIAERKRQINQRLVWALGAIAAPPSLEGQGSRSTE